MASGIDSGTNVFNKTASPALGFLMAGKLIFFLFPRPLELIDFDLMHEDVK